MKKLYILLLLLPIGIMAQGNEGITSNTNSYITFDLISPMYMSATYLDISGSYPTPRWRLGYVKGLTETSKARLDLDTKGYLLMRT